MHGGLVFSASPLLVCQSINYRLVFTDPFYLFQLYSACSPCSYKRRLLQNSQPWNNARKPTAKEVFGLLLQPILVVVTSFLQDAIASSFFPPCLAPHKCRFASIASSLLIYSRNIGGKSCAPMLELKSNDADVVVVRVTGRIQRVRHGNHLSCLGV